MRAAERALERVRLAAEHVYVEAAGGVKALGPNIVDQERSFSVLLAADEKVLAAEQAFYEAEHVYEMAKAKVREYECEQGARVLFHG